MNLWASLQDGANEIFVLARAVKVVSWFEDRWTPDISHHSSPPPPPPVLCWCVTNISVWTSGVKPLNPLVQSTYHEKHTCCHADRHMQTHQSRARGHSVAYMNAVASESALCQSSVCVHVHGCPCAKPLGHLWKLWVGCNGQVGH